MTSMSWVPPPDWRSAIIGQPDPTVQVTGEQLAIDRLFRFWEPDGSEIHAVGEPFIWPTPQGSLAPELSSMEIEWYLSLGHAKTTLEVLTGDVLPL